MPEDKYCILCGMNATVFTMHHSDLDNMDYPICSMCEEEAPASVIERRIVNMYYERNRSGGFMY